MQDMSAHLHLSSQQSLLIFLFSLHLERSNLVYFSATHINVLVLKCALRSKQNVDRWSWSKTTIGMQHRAQDIQSSSQEKSLSAQQLCPHSKLTTLPDFLVSSVSQDPGGLLLIVQSEVYSFTCLIVTRQTQKEKIHLVSLCLHAQRLFRADVSLLCSVFSLMVIACTCTEELAPSWGSESGCSVRQKKEEGSEAINWKKTIIEPSCLEEIVFWKL